MCLQISFRSSSTFLSYLRLESAFHSRLHREESSFGTQSSNIVFKVLILERQSSKTGRTALQDSSFRVPASTWVLVRLRASFSSGSARSTSLKAFGSSVALSFASLIRASALQVKSARPAMFARRPRTRKASAPLILKSHSVVLDPLFQGHDSVVSQVTAFSSTTETHRTLQNLHETTEGPRFRAAVSTLLRPVLAARLLHVSGIIPSILAYNDHS